MMKFIFAIPIIFSLGCGAAPWQVARTTLDATRTAFGVVSQMDEVGLDEDSQPVQIANSAFRLGELAVDAWEAAATPDPPSGWDKWVRMALEAIAAVAAIIKASGVDLPFDFEQAACALQSFGDGT